MTDQDDSPLAPRILRAMTGENLTTDTAEALAFATQWLELTGVGHITLTAIPAAGGATTTKTFAPQTFEIMSRWVENAQRQRNNVYFQVNETHPDCRRKPAKTDMIAAVCRHADIDPQDAVFPYAEERARLHRLVEYLHQDPAMPPTMVLDSGNGVYPLWAVTRQLLAPGVQEEIEAQNQAIEAAVGAGGTHNVDRLLRLPGTLNFPNAKKLRLGRGVARAKMLHRSGRTYTPDEVSSLGAHLVALMDGTDLVRPFVPPSDQKTAKREERTATPRDSAPLGRDRSAIALRKGAELYRAGKTFEEMCAALATDPETADWTREKGEKNDNRELWRIWDKAMREDTNRRRDANRQVFQLVAGQLHTAASHGEAAMLAFGQPVYQRGSKLVRPFNREVRASGGRTAKAADLAELNAHALIDLLSEASDWERFDARSEAWVSANPPMPVAQILLTRQGHWKFPPIAGVITSPTLRPDGSILSAPGYDPQTKLYHVADDGLVLHPGLDAPTRDLAGCALAVLSALLAEFPFVIQSSDGQPPQHVAEAVALSAMITPVVRGALTVAPLHAFRATTAGSGKSYLADVVSAISTGRPCPVISAAPDEAETEKRITGLLLAGFPIVSIDNVNGELGGDLLCQAVERPLIRVRPLGSSEIVEIENSASLLATGNQMRVRGDMVRRTLICDLDAKQERPELREFKADPVATVMADRGLFVSACLMIVRAYIAAGKPGCLAPIASFADWSNLVRSALVWLGCDDPAQSMEAARADDPELGELREMLAAWQAIPEAAQGCTTREIVAKAEIRRPTVVGEPTDYAHPDLHELLLRLFGERGAINTKRLGKWLHARERRIVDGKRFVRRGNASGGVARWAVEDAAS
jgi:hypothetical protein